MLQYIADHYLLFKSLHIISFVAWMAGLFYLPRLFVYHVTSPECGYVFQIMERKLYNMIMMPSMISTIISGTILVIRPGILHPNCRYLKIACVFGLIMFQFLLNRWRKQLVAGTCQRSSGFFRLINEIPTILLIIIVFCVVLKPF